MLRIGPVIDPKAPRSVGCFPWKRQRTASRRRSSPSLNNTDNPIVTNWLAAGDLNGDGFLDLVVTVSFARATSFLSQAGTTFQAITRLVGRIRGCCRLGDVNNDGCLDAVEPAPQDF